MIYLKRWLQFPWLSFKVSRTIRVVCSHIATVDFALCILSFSIVPIFLTRALYHPHALLLAEEAHIISGLLVGLNVIDCNLCLRDRDLDSLPQVRLTCWIWDSIELVHNVERMVDIYQYSDINIASETFYIGLSLRLGYEKSHPAAPDN